MTPLEALEPIVRLIFVAVGLGILSIGIALVISAISDPEFRDDAYAHRPTSVPCPNCNLFTRPCCNSVADNPHRESCATWGDLYEPLEEEVA